MRKSADAFRSIGEVSRLTGVAPHVLRYWETQFPLFSPVKRRDGRRYYRPDDVRLAAGLCMLLREDGMTIRGAKKLMAADRGAGLRARGAERLGDLLDSDASDAATQSTAGNGPGASSDLQDVATTPDAVPGPRPPDPKSRAALVEDGAAGGDAVADPHRPHEVGLGLETATEGRAALAPTGGSSAGNTPMLARLERIVSGLAAIDPAPALQAQAEGLAKALRAARDRASDPLHSG